MRRRLRLVHSSDVHLTPAGGSSHDPVQQPGTGELLSHEEAGFLRLVDTVVAEEADLLLIAGDLFDSNRVGEREVRFVELHLRRLACPVVLIPGNHDCYEEGSIYRRFGSEALGPNVHLLLAAKGETLSLPELGVTLWGRGLVEHDLDYRPLHGAPARANGDWFVGLAHGLVVTDVRELRASKITPEEIAAAPFDYLALGHVHMFRDVSHGETRAFYPGAPAVPYAPHKASLALVTLDPEAGVTVECRPLLPVG